LHGETEKNMFKDYSAYLNILSDKSATYAKRTKVSG